MFSQNKRYRVAGATLWFSLFFTLANCGPARRVEQTGEDALVEDNDRIGSASGSRLDVDTESISNTRTPSFSFSASSAASYSTDRETACDRKLGLIRVKTALQRDCRLDRVALTVSKMSEAGLPITASAVGKAMWWHGIPEATRQVALIRESSEDDLLEKVENYLEKQAGGGANRYGFAVREIIGGQDVVIVASRTHLDLKPVPRNVNRAGRLRIKGSVEPLYKGLQIVVVDPEGKTIEYEVEIKRGRFERSFQANKKGLWQIEIMGDGPKGPTGLANFPIAVGVSFSDSVTSKALELESKNPRVLERLMWDALDKTRKDKRLAALKRSRKLAKVARSYSSEMAETGVVAHVSPLSGTVADRVRAAGIKFYWVSENLGKAMTAREAHEGLMGSPAHRANILNSRASKAGIGVAIVDDGETEAVIVTQIFLLDRAPVDSAFKDDDVIEMINNRRERLGLSKLTEHSWLTRAASRIGKSCFKDDTQGPRIRATGSPYKKVKVIAFQTNNLLESITEVRGLVKTKETDIGVNVRKGSDPETGYELVCVTVLLGRR